MSDHNDPVNLKTEEALRRESEERYRAFIANSSEGIWRCELEQPLNIDLPADEQIEAYYRLGYLAECNDAMARMYGYEKAEELVGARLGDLLVRSDPANDVLLRAFISSGFHLIDLESSEIDKTGREKFFANNFTGIVENGLLYHVWGTQRDITERKRTEQRFTILHGITRIIADKAPEENAAPAIIRLICESLNWEIGALWMVERKTDRIGCVEVWTGPGIDVSDFGNFTQDLTFALGEGIPGLVWQSGDFLWIEDVGVATFPRTPLASREGVRAAVCFPLKLRSEIIGVIEFFSREIRSPDEKLRELMSAVSNQIAQLIERGQVEQARDESEERYRTLAETASDGIITVNEASTIIFVNPAISRIFGYTVDEMAGQSLTMLMPNYLKHLHRAGMKRYLDTGQRHISWDGMELPGLHKTGDEIPLEISFGESHIHGERLFTGIVRDISERRRAEEERARLLRNEQEARQKAEDASRLKDEFLATVSHELRTPLTAVVGWARMLQTGELDEETRNEALMAITRNAKSQTQLVDDLLDVSRIITGRLRLNVRSTDPVGFIESAVEAVRPAAEAKGVRLHTVIDTGAGAVAGDPERLQQVVWNLLSNAIRYTPRAGRVQVKLERIDSSIQIEVSDNGSGISADFLPFVFDRFRQADMSTTRQHGGLGLGLSIVRHLTELHGGSVQADSAGEGRGSRFIVKLPVVGVYHKDTAPEDEKAAALEVNYELDRAARLDDVRLLVVDDEADTRDVLERMLSQYGAEVVTAGSAAEAYEKFVGSNFDLLMCDIGMAGEDGYDLIRKIRACPVDEGARIPAIALTAYARAEDRLRALRAGYQMHVPKPVEVAELVAIVASLVQRSGRKLNT